MPSEDPAGAADPRTPPGGPVRFGVVGTGFRAAAFADLARRLPERFAVVGVVSRGEERRREVAARWGVPAHARVADLAAQEPDVVLTSVPWEANRAVVEELVLRGVPVLSETPPADDAEGLRALWSRVGASGLVQVAEQYALQPMNAARAAVLRDGAIGRVTSAQVSMTQLYHAVSLLRSFLGVRAAPAEVRAVRAVSPLADPLSRAGWAERVEERELATTIATIAWPGAVGLYDFTETQTRNPLRSSRVVVRGSRGELVDERVVRVVAPATVVESPLVRRQTGAHRDFEVLDLDHISLDGRVVHRNPYCGARLSDEEIAMATLLERTGAWARGRGPAPYPLAEACEDHLLALAVEAAADSGRPVQVDPGPWAAA